MSHIWSNVRENMTDCRGSTNTTIVLMKEDGTVVAEGSGPHTNQWVCAVYSMNYLHIPDKINIANITHS